MKDTAPEPTSPNAPCPCGSGRTYGDCCGPLISGERAAASAEALMRARFSAHATGNMAFIHRTYRETAGQPLPQETGVPQIEWTKLVIHQASDGNSPGVAYVDFTAYGSEQGSPIVHHEKAEFVRQAEGWIYTRPVREGPVPVRAAARIGRNDPCPCGSGKKYKHCCGNPARAKRP